VGEELEITTGETRLWIEAHSWKGNGKQRFGVGRAKVVSKNLNTLNKTNEELELEP
jgi:hypothetical protein